MAHLVPLGKGISRDSVNMDCPGCSMTENFPSHDFIPRPYQSELLEVSLKQNTIVFLPTGSGKTYIAVMLIKRMSTDIHNKYSNGGKRTFFLVNTVALAEQQKDYIQRHTHLSVGHYTGDMNVDHWNKEIWLEELNRNQVLVMTGQIFLDIVSHNYIKLNEVNLIVFDECHHAVSEHCFVKIMEGFTYCQSNLQPRVLGLTATLLNKNCKVNKVQDMVSKLEKTYRSTVAKIDSVSEIQRFSTNPVEKVLGYNNPIHFNVIDQVKLLLEDVKDFVITYPFENSGTMYVDNMELHKTGRTTGEKLANKLLDLEYHINTLGIYGGSLAAHKHMVHLERLRTKCENAHSMVVYTCLITTLTVIRKLLEDEMLDTSGIDQIFKYSSPQVLTLFEVLRDSTLKENGRGIIFVERRFTAKTLYLILRDLSEASSDFSFLKPDFVVGFQSTKFNFTRESALERKWTREAIQKFQKGQINVIVASDVLEEGIDIPSCNLVIRFDIPKSYRSYVQSKGRARSAESQFYLLIPRITLPHFKETFIEYQEVEKLMENILLGKCDTNDDDLEDSDEDEEEEEEPDLVSRDGQARLSFKDAIPLINRYCTKLPQDKFTKLIPYWYMTVDLQQKRRFRCILQLPINSCLKDAFKGNFKSSKRRARQSAALLACKKLYAAGELDDHLLPLGKQLGKLQEEHELFEIYSKAKKEETMSQPGTKKCRRQYKKWYPTCLKGCAPTNTSCYLHVMVIKPAYPEPTIEESRKYCFYKLLSSDRSFAILSPKPLPQVCQFPIFLNIGKVEISLLVNHRIVTLSDMQIEKLKEFNMTIFINVLKLWKSYVVSNIDNGENAFITVPTKIDSSGNHEIDWEVVHKEYNITITKEPRADERLGENENWREFEHSLVVPWYRGLPPEQMYVVTKVCDDLTPQSPFPTNTYSTFEEYYQRKYYLNIKHTSQPLFEVKPISNSFNCLQPRGHVCGRSKRQEENEDFVEHLVPELCVPVNFYSDLWLKATCLPSSLHRIHYLLIAEELRQEIARDLNFPLAAGNTWKALDVDPNWKEVEESEPTTSQNHAPSSVTVSNTLKFYDWIPEEEPIDIDREKVEEVTLMEIRYYDDFVSKPLLLNGTSHLLGQKEQEEINCQYSRFPPKCDVPSIGILEKVKNESKGPELYEILQAITCLSSNDTLNLERLETLGDSYLKFTASLFLFLKYPHFNEGVLTQLKGKIVGNRNLFYCGVNRNIPERIKVYEFTSKSDWIPPNFCVPSILQKAFQELEICPSHLYELSFPKEEQDSGQLSIASIVQCQELIDNFKTKSSHSPSESNIGIQTVPDKVVADSVEALIGAYLQGFGIDGALQLLGWFKILPKQFTDPSWLFGDLTCTAYVFEDEDFRKHSVEVNFHLPSNDAEDLEKVLNYKFNDRGYLLQALSHASYLPNRVTDCYQRLEFLGDAILDFLVTCHIFETCRDLRPGELTDLRSALVNNITFGSLAVRYGFHKFCRYDTSKLFEKVDTFVKFQQLHGHRISEDVLLLLGEDETSDEQIAECVDVPKVLGDLFESIAAAIYLDSGKSLQAVWNVYYRLMKNELQEFSENIPKQPVRLLYEKCVSPPIFQKACKLENHDKVMVELEVILGDTKRRYYGVGENKADAKRTAAKIALQDMKL